MPPGTAQAGWGGRELIKRGDRDSIPRKALSKVVKTAINPLFFGTSRKIGQVRGSRVPSWALVRLLLKT